MKAVVTGGAGFIGSHVVDALIERGAEVLVIDDFSTGREENLVQARENAGSKISVLQASICSEEAVAEIRSFKPEALFHFAAQINVRNSVADPCFDATTNVVGTVNLLEVCKNAGAQRFIMASTGGAMYGEQEEFPAPETSAIKPEAPYGVSKRAGEFYLEYYARAFPIATAALRFGNVYGPRQNAKGEAGVVAIFSERLIAGEALRVNGDGLQTRDYVHVEDVVRASMLSFDKLPQSGFSVFNVGLGIETTVIDLVDALKKAWAELGTGSEVVVEYGPALPGEQRRSVIDASAISTALGWQSQVGLTQGIHSTLKSFIEASSG